MVILVDTNVILDILLERKSYTNAAQIIMQKCANREIIVTRNPNDYKKSRIKVIEPDEFVKLL